MKYRVEGGTYVVPGTAMKSMIYDYPEYGMKAYKSKESIRKAGETIPYVPLVYNHTSEPDVHVEERDQIIGGFRVSSTSDGSMKGDYIFNVDKTPPCILKAIRNGEKIPTSTGYEYTKGVGGEGYDFSQENILMKHVAVFDPSDYTSVPRCSVQGGCGVGVDSLNKDVFILQDAMILNDTFEQTGESFMNEQGIESSKPDEHPATMDAHAVHDAAFYKERYLSALDSLKEEAKKAYPCCKDDIDGIDSIDAIRILMKTRGVAHDSAAVIPQGEPVKELTRQDMRSESIERMRAKSQGLYKFNKYGELK